MPDLTQEALERLLAWLDPDPDRAARRYENIRARLIRFFREHGARDWAEELVDQTIDLVATRIGKTKEEPPLDPEKYFLTAALLVLTKLKRRQSNLFESEDAFERNLAEDPFSSPGRAALDRTSNRYTRKKSLARKPGKTPAMRSRVVSTGFCPAATPDTPIDPKIALRVATTYYFWFEIGKAQKGSIESTPTDIPAVPANALLTIVLFGFK